MKSMNQNQTSGFLTFLKKRIERHYQSMSGAKPRHRVLIKTERAEAEVILSTFLAILNDQTQ
jgi:hypothetical protein